MSLGNLIYRLLVNAYGSLAPGWSSNSAAFFAFTFFAFYHK
jgi:hypothetical protein